MEDDKDRFRKSIEKDLHAAGMFMSLAIAIIIIVLGVAKILSIIFE
jgi:hypothetical protein